MGFIGNLFGFIRGVTKKTPLLNAKELEFLIDGINKDYQTYKDTAFEHNDKIATLISEYNSHIQVLESGKIDLRNKTAQLYKSLSRLIGVGEEINESDELIPVSGFPEPPPVLKSLLPDLGLDGNINDLKRQFRNAVEIEKLTEKYNNLKVGYSDDIWERRSFLDAAASAKKIAGMYIQLVETTIDAIDNDLLPELNGIYGFLYADAVKIYGATDKEFTEVTPKSISEYRGNDSPYNRHHEFVKNAVDYYITVCRLLTEPFLQRIVASISTAKDIANEFDMSYKDVASNLEAVSDSIILSRNKPRKK